MKPLQLLRSFWFFLKSEKKYWALPLAFGFFLLLLLILLSESAPLLSPFFVYDFLVLGTFTLSQMRYLWESRNHGPIKLYC